MFTPRIHENGGPCCTVETAQCDKCKAHAQSHRTASGFLLRASEAHPPRGALVLRTASQVAAEFARRAVPAPDPYAPATLRAAERTEAITHATGLFVERELPPDGYAIARALRTLEVR